MLTQKLMGAGGVGRPTLGGVASSHSFDDTNPYEATIPSEASTGDLLYMFLSGSSLINTPSGWTEHVANQRSSICYAVYSKVADVTDPGSTFTYDTSNSDQYSVTIAAFSNAVLSVDGGERNTRSTDISVDGITTLNDNDIVVVWAAMEGLENGEHPMDLVTSGYTDITGGTQPTDWEYGAGIHYKVQETAGDVGSIVYGTTGNNLCGYGSFSLTSAS